MRHTFGNYTPFWVDCQTYVLFTALIAHFQGGTLGFLPPLYHERVARAGRLYCYAPIPVTNLTSTVPSCTILAVQGCSGQVPDPWV